MTYKPCTRLIALAVQLLLLAGALVSAVNAKSALGGYQPDVAVAMAHSVGKSLNVLDIFLDFETAALGCCIGPEGNLPDTPNGGADNAFKGGEHGDTSKPAGDGPEGNLPDNKNNLDEAFHYTDAKWKDTINEKGLWEGSYATPAGDLSPTQASIELSLPPNRNLPDAKLRIDLDAMRKDGYKIPQPTRVSNTVTDANGRVYTRPGGGYEIKFDYEIPPKYISIVE